MNNEFLVSIHMAKLYKDKRDVYKKCGIVYNKC